MSDAVNQAGTATVARAAMIEGGATDAVECDVLIAGSGAAGLATALTANHHGLDVIVTEKEPVYGGTTAYSAGVIWVPGNAQAVRAGIDDSPATALRYLEAEIGHFLERAKAEAFVNRAAEMLDFFERTTHVRYQMQKVWSDYHPELPGAASGGRSLLPEPFDGRLLGEHFRTLRAPIATMMLFGGLSISRDDIPHLFNVTRSARSAWYVTKLMLQYLRDRLNHARGTQIANGNALVGRMVLSMLERNMPLWLEAPLVQLTQDGGRITGGIVQRNGRDITVRARCGVVLASGGFPRSDEMRARHYRHVEAGGNHIPLAPPGNTGDGARLARAVGGSFTAEAHQPAAWTPISLVPQKDGGTIPFPHFIDRCKPGYIAVAPHGRRFANEADSYHDFVPLMIEACKGRKTIECFLVTDHRAIRRYGMGAIGPAPIPLGPHLRSGYLTRADTPEALAKKLGLDASTFAATLARYNEHASRGEDPDFGKGTNAYHRFGGDPTHGPNPNLAPIVTGPFYAMRMVPSDLGTFLGISTDEKSRVLDVNERPIPGLYAAGNDQASVMGGRYPGAGITIGPALTFGYIAGRHLAGVDP